MATTYNFLAMPTEVNYALRSGDYTEIPFAVVDVDGNPVDLTGVTITGAYTRQGAIAVAKTITISDGVVIDNVEIGHGRIGFHHDMESGIYDYDLQFDFPTVPPGRQTLMIGVCALDQDITP